MNRKLMDKFTLNWRGHIIEGKSSYLTPWKLVTDFATDLSTRLSARFPKTSFLDALEIINPTSWKEHRDTRFNSGT